MGLIQRGVKSATGTTAFGASTKAKSSEVNTDLNTLYTAINGNIDNDNIKADAAIVASKLNLGSISQNIENTGTLDNIGDLSVTGAVECDSLQLTTDVVITSFVDEDDMASDSAVAIPTQQSVKAYVDSVSFLGSWVDKSSDYGAQQASTDGFVVATLVQANVEATGTAAALIGKTDANASPSAVRGYANTSRTRSDLNADVSYSSFLMPVRSGDYWSVTYAVLRGTPSVTIAVYWISK